MRNEVVASSDLIMLYSSGVGAAQLCMLAVIDEVTDSFVEEDRGPIGKDSHVSFFLEIDEGIFILSFYNTYSFQIGINNFEVVSDAH